jgi:predicted nucleotidyltransferase component of viral defense system
LILHRLLIELSSNKDFFENYAFKGGTCLMKCYLNYYRFSEDLDFTYINQKELAGKTGNQVRISLSKRISSLANLLVSVSKNMGIDFKAEKTNNHYVEYGKSNKQVTFKLWYVPQGSSTETFIKIQINFLETLEYAITQRHANNFLFGKHDNFRDAFLLPENSEWVLKIPSLNCYDIKEILIEKVRAVLTRKGIKARDYIDIYMIEKAEKLNVKDFRKKIINKVVSALKFEKYKLNLMDKKAKDFTFDRKEEERILIVPLPKDFDAFFERLKVFLEELLEEINLKQ